MGRRIMIWPALRMRRVLVARVLTRRGALALVAVATVLAAGSLLPPTAEAAIACRATYTTPNVWPGGFQGNVAVTNLGDPLDSWVIGIVFSRPGAQLTQGWNATWTQAGNTMTGASLPWNGPLPTNGTVTVGFNGTYTGTPPVPIRVTLNGVPCSGVGTP